MHALKVTRAEDFPEWYQAVVREADLAELSPTRGCMNAPSAQPAFYGKCLFTGVPAVEEILVARAY